MYWGGEGALRASSGENCIPCLGRGFVFNAKLSEFELTFPDPMHEFNVGDGVRSASKALPSKHRTKTKFDRSMVMLYQVVEIFRGPEFGSLAASVFT